MFESAGAADWDPPVRRTTPTSDDPSATSPVGTSSAPDASGQPGEAATLVERLAATFAPEVLAARSAEQLRDDVRLLRRLEGIATVGIAAAVRSLADQDALTADGASSPAAWVRSQTGRSGREAARTVRLGSAVADLPDTTAALTAGEVTAESADAIERAARDGRLGTPAETEARLLPVARAEGPEAVRAEARRLAQQADGAALVRDEQRQHARRRVSLTRRDDGMWDLFGLLPAEHGDRLRTLLDVHDRPDPAGTPVGERRRPGPATGGRARRRRRRRPRPRRQPRGAGRGPAPRLRDRRRHHLRRRPVRPRRPVTAPPHRRPRVDRAVARADLVGRSPVTPGRPRLCCDAGVSRILMVGESQVLDVGRLTRQWSPAQRRAIVARDRCCRGPGCQRPIAWTDIHHVQWWRHDGPTDLDNGLSLCRACHRLVHDVGWHVELDPTSRRRDLDLPGPSPDGGHPPTTTGLTRRPGVARGGRSLRSLTTAQ